MTGGLDLRLGTWFEWPTPNSDGLQVAERGSTPGSSPSESPLGVEHHGMSCFLLARITALGYTVGKMIPAFWTDLHTMIPTML